MEIGVSGHSNGMWIAERLGMRRETLEKAREILGTVNLDGERDKEEEITRMPQLQPVPAPPVSAGVVSASAPVEVEVATRPFRVGDSVYIGAAKDRGILCVLADAKGEVTVLVREKRIKVNQKRISLHIAAEQLYPDLDHYNLDIVMLSKADRKIKHDMGRKHVAGQERILSDQEIK